MNGYRDYASPSVGELIGQMALEMEKKADECRMLRSEIAKKDALLEQASRRIEALDEDCRSVRRDLACAQEERTKIATILGLNGSEESNSCSFAEKVPAHARGAHAFCSEPVSTSSDADLLEYASATLERMRQLNGR